MIDGDSAVHLGERGEEERTKGEAENEDRDDERGKHGRCGVELNHYGRDTWGKHRGC